MFTAGEETGGTYAPPQLGITPPSLSDGSHAPGGPGGIQPPDLSGLGGLLGGLAQVIGGHGLLGALAGQNGPSPEEQQRARQQQTLGYLNAINTGTGMAAAPGFTQFQNEYAAAERAAAARFQALTGTAVHPIPDAGPDLPPPTKGAEPRDFPPPGEEPQPPDMPTPSPTGPIPGFTPPGAMPEPRDLPPPDNGPRTDRGVTTAPRVPSALPPEIREIPVETEPIPNALPPEIRELVPPEIPDALPQEIRDLVPRPRPVPAPAPTEREITTPYPSSAPTTTPTPRPYAQPTPVPPAVPVRSPYEIPTPRPTVPSPRTEPAPYTPPETRVPREREAPTSFPMQGPLGEPLPTPTPTPSPRPYPSTGPAPVPSPTPFPVPQPLPTPRPTLGPTPRPTSGPYSAPPQTVAPPRTTVVPPRLRPGVVPTTALPPVTLPFAPTAPSAPLAQPQPVVSSSAMRPVFFGGTGRPGLTYAKTQPRISQAEYMRWLKTLAAIRENMRAAR